MKDQLGGALLYENAKEAMISAGADASAIDNAVLSQSFVRLEQLLTTSNTVYTFPLLNNQSTGTNTVRTTEQRLNLQDVLFVADLGIYIVKAASGTATNLQLDTYPNPVTFTTGAAALYSFYAGKFSLTVNNSQIVPSMDIQRFLMVPQTQLTAATNSPIDEFYGAGELSSQCVIQPNFVLNGQRNTSIQITLPGNITAIDANTYAVIVFRGLLAQNVTVVS